MINNQPPRTGIWTRIKFLMPIKAMGTTLFIYIFFRAYFWVMENPSSAPYVMPTTLVDDIIHFNSYALPVYLSLWIYVSLPPALLNSLSALVLYGTWNALMCLSCLVIFWAWPTATPPADIDIIQHPSMAFLRVDTGLNAFPSLHVASSVFTSIWLSILLRKASAPPIFNVVNICYCLLIIWSTIAVRQHVFLDAVSGVVVGIIFALLSVSSLMKRVRPDEI